MSYHDSRAGNATSARASVLNRVRGDMRIVCLITVGAFLLSIAIAESDVPVGASQYQRPRPIILEPVLKMNSNGEDNPINWFIKMVHRAIEPKKPPSPMIGPINLPGMGGHIYIRQVEKSLMPWENNRVVIKLVSRDPIHGNALPIDSQSYHHRPEDPSRRTAKNYGYQPTVNVSPRSNHNAAQSGFVPVSPQSQYNSPYPSQSQHNPHYPSQYSSPYPSHYPSQYPSQHPPWHPQPRPRYPSHVAQYPKPFRGSSPNDFRHENYGKDPDQGYPRGSPEDYARRRPSRMNSVNSQRFTPGVAQPMNAVPLPSMYRSVARQPPNPDPVYTGHEYRDRFKDTGESDTQDEGFYPSGSADEKPDSPTATQLPYPEYAGLSDAGLSDAELEPLASTKADNVTLIEPTSAAPLDNFVRYSIPKPPVRNDRTVVVGDGNNPRGYSRGRATSQRHRGTKARGFRGGARAAKLEARDVGGIEVIAAPNLQRGWEDEAREARKSKEDDNYSPASRESSLELNDDDDSIRMENGRKLARGESVEHSSEQPESQSDESRAVVSRHSAYKVIDRSHRSPGNFTLGGDNREAFGGNKIEDRINQPGEARPKEQDVHVVYPEANGTANNVTAEVVQKVVNLTQSRRQGRRKPRVVKAIYRRKVVPEILKRSAESAGSSEEKSSKESSSSEN